MGRDSNNTKRPVLLHVLRGNARPIPSERDWEERRSRQQRTSEPKAPSVALLADISWLSMVCFVEGIVPDTLGLSEELTCKVRADLETLEGHDTLEMYWSCLNRLRRIGAPDQREEGDASDSE
ncbi:MAG: hypothetical protein RL326_1017 [Pseudomonadota bacterium]